VDEENGPIMLVEDEGDAESLDSVPKD